MTTFQEGDLLRINWKIQLLSLSRVVWRARAHCARRLVAGSVQSVGVCECFWGITFYK